MSIQLHTVDNGNVQAINDGRLYGEITGNVGGIVNGSVVTSAGGLALHVTSGWGIGYGRVFTITADDYTVQPASSGTQKGRLYVHIDISNPDNPIDIRSVAAASLPPLVQQNLSEGGAIYEIELAHYDVTSLAVSNLVSNTKVKFAGHAGDSDRLGGIGASGYTPIGELTQITNFNPIIDAGTADIKVYTMGKLVVAGGSFRFTGSASVDQALFRLPAPITGLGRYSWGAIYKYTSTAVIPVRLGNDGTVLTGASTGSSYTGDYFIKMVYIKE